MLLPKMHLQKVYKIFRGNAVISSYIGMTVKVSNIRFIEHLHSILALHIELFLDIFDDSFDS